MADKKSDSIQKAGGGVFCLKCLTRHCRQAKYKVPKPRKTMRRLADEREKRWANIYASIAAAMGGQPLNADIETISKYSGLDNERAAWALGKLPAHLARLLSLRYSGRHLTQSDVARLVGVSRSRISSLERTAWLRLTSIAYRAMAQEERNQSEREGGDRDRNDRR